MEYTCIRKCYFLNRRIMEDEVIEVKKPSADDKKMLERCFKSDKPAKKAVPKKPEGKLPDAPDPEFLK